MRQSISPAPQHKERDECQEIKTIEVSAAQPQLCTLQPPVALHYSIKPADCVSQSDEPGLNISTFHIKVLIFNLQTLHYAIKRDDCMTEFTFVIAFIF